MAVLAIESDLRYEQPGDDAGLVNFTYHKGFYPFGLTPVGGMTVVYAVATGDDGKHYVITPDWAGERSLAIECDHLKEAEATAETLALDLLSFARDWAESGKPEGISVKDLTEDGRLK